MPEQLMNVLVQLPVVAAFVWYSDRMYRQFQEFLREERAARDSQIQALAIELRALRAELASAARSGHDAKERCGNGD